MWLLIWGSVNFRNCSVSVEIFPKLVMIRIRWNKSGSSALVKPYYCIVICEAKLSLKRKKSFDTWYVWYLIFSKHFILIPHNTPISSTKKKRRFLLWPINGMTFYRCIFLISPALETFNQTQCFFPPISDFCQKITLVPGQKFRPVFLAKRFFSRTIMNWPEKKKKNWPFSIFVQI